MPLERRRLPKPEGLCLGCCSSFLLLSEYIQRVAELEAVGAPGSCLTVPCCPIAEPVVLSWQAAECCLLGCAGFSSRYVSPLPHYSSGSASSQPMPSSSSSKLWNVIFP